MDTLLSLSVLISCVLSRHLLNTGTQFEADWENGGTIPSSRTEAIVFNFDTKIFILGGWNNPRALIECDISSALSCTPATTPFNHDIRTYSQSYTQIGNLGYLLGDYITAQTSLYVYTLSNNAPTLSKTITIPKNRAGNTACLTNTNDKLFVIGGQDKAHLGTTYYHSPTLQIYNLPNGPWETNLNQKNMNQGRDSFACVVVGDYVYALGGYSKLYAVNNNRDIERIERIQITNIVANSWDYTPYNLKEGINSFRAIAIDHYIITIGGLKTNVATVTPAQSIQIINTIDNTIDYGGTFTTRSYANAVIHIGNMVYAFGGWDGNVNPVGILNTWQYLQLSTDSPTTNNPTTNNPTTFNPTTFNPTTFNPTTFNPTTTNPTTNNPTTTNPTTFNPTTTNPTTFNPTTNPSTNNPTTNNPTTTNPTTNNPTTNNPTTNNPTTTNPTTNNPTTNNPTLSPFTTSPTTIQPTTSIPTNMPSQSPITSSPTKPGETLSPTLPSNNPSTMPTNSPSKDPTDIPTSTPTKSPSIKPTQSPLPDGVTHNPAHNPTHNPTLFPSKIPTINPIINTNNPSNIPTTTGIITTESDECDISWSITISFRFKFLFDEITDTNRLEISNICKDAFYETLLTFVWDNMFCFDLFDDKLEINKVTQNRRNRMLLEDSEYEIQVSFEYNNELQNAVFNNMNNVYNQNKFKKQFANELCEGFVALEYCTETNVADSMIIDEPVEYHEYQNKKDNNGIINILIIIIVIVVVLICVGMIFYYVRKKSKDKQNNEIYGTTNTGIQMGDIDTKQKQTILCDNETGGETVAIEKEESSAE